MSFKHLRDVFTLIFYQCLYGFSAMTGTVVTPVLAAKSRRVAEGFHDYLGNLPKNRGESLIWVHAVSLGESMVAAAFMDFIKRRHPGAKLGFTTTHPDVMAGVRRREKAPLNGYFPLDFFPFMIRAFKRFRPKAVVVCETDFWPLFSMICRLKKIPLILINGRLSDKLARFYSSFPSLGRLVFESFSLFCVQTPADKMRLESMGAPESRIQVTGNIKCDLVPASVKNILEPLRKWKGDSRLSVFGSLHPSEFTAFEAFFRSIASDSAMKVMIAPRDIKNAGNWQKRLAELGIKAVLRSEVESAGDAGFLLLDTLGELASLYFLADGAFVGGSLDPEVGGHNPLEVLHAGVPLVMGPHVRNFADIIDQLSEVDGIKTAHNAREAENHLRGFINFPQQSQRQIAAAKTVLELNQGAIRRTYDLVRPCLDL